MADRLAPLRTGARAVLDFALPPRCPACGAIVDEPHLFCLDCWSSLDFLGSPCCDRCAHPFDHEVGEGALCAGCAARPPDFDRARAAVAYGDVSRQVAIKLKYGGRPGVAETMARLMARHLDPALDPILAPVPLHRWRIWKRGYNQAALIAGSLAARSRLEAQLDLLQRVRPTPPLGRMSPRQRRQVLNGAIRVSPRHALRVRGRAILLVDDVYTSGATAEACARVLRRAGAKRVDLLCWAKVVTDPRSG